ncbi:hypothetical protein SLA2020_284440 [Shorea laevis]
MVSRTKVRGPMSWVRNELEALVTKLKSILKNKRQTQVMTTTPTTLTLRNEIEVSFWKRQVEVLGDGDTKEEYSHYSNFSFYEGPEMVSEEELDPEEHPHIYYDPDEDVFFDKPANVLSDMDRLETHSGTSSTLLVMCRLPILRTEFL